MHDVVVVGGGVIGLSIAYELAGQGASVRIVERGDFGGEASWAGAGILPPGNPDFAAESESRLRAQSHVMWPVLSEELRETTGVDNGFRVCGGMQVRIDGNARQLSDEVDFWCNEGVAVQELDQDNIYEYESALSPDVTAAYRLAELGQVRNPRHLKALQTACSERGVELSAGTPVCGFKTADDRVQSLQTDCESIHADRFCLASGAWTSRLVRSAGRDVEIEPVRGQIVQLSMTPVPFRHVIECGARYLVPRPDGRILIGSTEEHVGFEKRNTAEAVARLIDFAVSLVPCLADAKFERAWSGLRPGSPDGLPYLGLVPGFDNLFVAAGHFRSGLQLSPATALLLRQLILEQDPFMDPTDVRPSRDTSQVTASG